MEAHRLSLSTEFETCAERNLGSITRLVTSVGVHLGAFRVHLGIRPEVSRIAQNVSLSALWKAVEFEANTAQLARKPIETAAIQRLAGWPKVCF